MVDDDDEEDLSDVCEPLRLINDRVGVRVTLA